MAEAVQGADPAKQHVQEVADEIVADEGWAESTLAEVTTFLSRLVRGEPFVGAVPAENIIILAFVCAADLLSSNRRDDEKWWNYLDRAEAAG
ncbi:hypothetical protein [Micromonospora cathayae]|uniref:Uncharacterized protein n=1 Tax=Micromonospora cathayae TaxID=3028804 RepID=A0ABY7ZP65_9ACTN|nr:hypothetical protein [Micromonospora sp. HUAS 3]WDZ84288.1 hypothetical protein PVK37_28160 [Micromonospora sp. HUAS 3]